MENSGLNYQSGPNIAGGATNPTYHHYRSAGHNGAKTFLKSHLFLAVHHSNRMNLTATTFQTLQMFSHFTSKTKTKMLNKNVDGV